jgi:hypothetical protein
LAAFALLSLGTVPAPATDIVFWVLGTVLLPDGAPAADLLVEYQWGEVCSPQQCLQGPVEHSTTRTDANGRFVFYWPGDREVSLQLGAGARFTVDEGSTAVSNHRPNSGDQPVYHLVDQPPTTVTLIPPDTAGWDPAAFDICRLLDSAWVCGFQPRKDGEQLTIEAQPGSFLAARYAGGGDYYRQWIGGGDLDITTYAPASAQFHTPTDGSATSWPLTLERGSAVHGQWTTTDVAGNQLVRGPDWGTVSLVRLFVNEQRWEVVAPCRDCQFALTNTSSQQPEFTISGLVPGGFYTLFADGAYSFRGWLGGASGDNPVWSDVIKGAFTAPAAGSVLTGADLSAGAAGTITSRSYSRDVQAFNIALNGMPAWVSLTPEEFGPTITTHKTIPGVYLLVESGYFSDQVDHWRVLTAPTYGQSKHVNWLEEPQQQRAAADAKLGQIALSVNGQLVVGATLTAAATAPDSSVSSPVYSYFWTDGLNLLASNTAQYQVKPSDLGKSLTVLVVAEGGGAPIAWTTQVVGPISNPVVPSPSATICPPTPNVSATPSASTKPPSPKPPVKVKSTVKLKKLNKGRIQITVKAASQTKPTGKLSIIWGKKKLSATLKASHKGKIIVKQPKKGLKAGKSYKVKVKYLGSLRIKPTNTKTLRIKAL